VVRELSALGLAVGLFGAHDARAIPYFAGLGDLPGGEFQSQAYGLAVTESGPIVIGSSQTESGAEFFTWTPTTGLEPFPVGIARAISDDGSTVVGESGGPYRWTEADGTVYLGSLPDGTPTVLANDISADGNTVVGRAGSPSSEAFLWTAGTGAIGLGVPDTDTGDGASEAHAVSAPSARPSAGPRPRAVCRSASSEARRFSARPPPMSPSTAPRSSGKAGSKCFARPRERE